MTRLFMMCAVVGTTAGADILNVPGDFETIQAAIDARADGDEIVVAPGTYNEALFAETVPGSGIPRKVFTLRSSTRNPADVIIDASGLQAPALHLIEFTDPCTFEGLTFKGGVGALITPGNYLAGGGACCEAADAIFTKCVFFGNAADRGGAIFTYQSFGDFRVDHCIFRDNFAPLGGAWYSGFGSPDIVHSVFTRNSAASSLQGNGPGAFYFGPSTSPKIRNCIAWGNLPSAVGGFGTPDIAYSLIEGYVGGVANIDTDPMFIDSAANNFALMENSPCIDAGDAVVSSEGLLFDFAGQNRGLDHPEVPNTGRSIFELCTDLGAFEFQYESAPPPNPCPSDVNGSGTVDYEDLVNVLANWGPCAG
ncbi:MAG: choice-of-anchor Q domain-containing protein [Planctomycetota bacterium]|nr:choice-of-anchor Q domain-containing protein [Planctomycetota bacterium]